MFLSSVRKLAKGLGATDTPQLYNSEKASEKIKTYGQLFNNAEIVIALGPYLYHDPIVLYKLLRIMRHYLEKVFRNFNNIYVRYKDKK